MPKVTIVEDDRSFKTSFRHFSSLESLKLFNPIWAMGIK